MNLTPNICVAGVFSREKYTVGCDKMNIPLANTTIIG